MLAVEFPAAKQKKTSASFQQNMNIILFAESKVDVVFFKHAPERQHRTEWGSGFNTDVGQTKDNQTGTLCRTTATGRLSYTNPASLSRSANRSSASVWDPSNASLVRDARERESGVNRTTVVCGQRRQSRRNDGAARAVDSLLLR